MPPKNEARAAGKAPAARRAEIVNRRGLHASAAGKLAKLAASFEAETTVTRNDVTVTATSILGLMMLAAGPGSVVELRAEGPAAAQALEALTALIANKFGEDD